MKRSIVSLLLFSSASAFLAPSPLLGRRVNNNVAITKAIAGDIDAMAEERLDEIASRLKLQVYDVDTGVYGLDSKDPLYGIENIHTKVHMPDQGGLGLVLVR